MSDTAGHAMDSPHSWATACFAFASMFVAVGTGFSYGGLVLPLTRDLGVPHGGASGVFAVTIMVFFLAGAPLGMLGDRVGPRSMLVLGAVTLSGGLTLTASAKGLVQLYVGHGFLVGIAMATTFVPLVAVVGASFERRRSLAVGIAVSGIGVGTLVMAPLTAWLIAMTGWRSAYLDLAVVGGLVLLACAALVSAPTVHAGQGASVAETLRNRDYALLYCSQMLLAVAIFMPFAHLPAYAEQSGTDPVAAAGLVGVIGAASVVGRLALAHVADRIGALRVYRGCFLAIGVSFAPWLWPDAPYAALLGHAVVFGVGYGGFIALLPGIVAERWGLQRLGGLLGVLYTSHAVGAGAGPLAAGLLIPAFGYLPAALAGLGCGLAATFVVRLVPQRALHRVS